MNTKMHLLNQKETPNLGVLVCTKLRPLMSCIKKTDPAQRKCSVIWTKAELMQVGIFFPRPFICMRNSTFKKGGS